MSTEPTLAQNVETGQTETISLRSPMETDGDEAFFGDPDGCDWVRVDKKRRIDMTFVPIGFITAVQARALAAHLISAAAHSEALSSPPRQEGKK